MAGFLEWVCPVAVAAAADGSRYHYEQGVLNLMI